MRVEMSAGEIAETQKQVSGLNKSLGITSGEDKNNLGKESFLKLLITQLKHQDPTNPMEDREFISQMAQFSSLEQMTNLNTELRMLIRSSQSTEAYGLIGKEIDSFDPDTNRRVSGIVSSVQYHQDRVRLMVNNQEVDIKNIHIVKQPDTVVRDAVRPSEEE